MENKATYLAYPILLVQLRRVFEKSIKSKNQLTRVFGRRPFRTAWLTDPYTCSLPALVQLDLVDVLSNMLLMLFFFILVHL